MVKLVDIESKLSLYESSEDQWLTEQINHLKSGEVYKLDRNNLITHLVEMSISDQRELTNRFAVLIQHMLKFEFQPDKATDSWVHTILDQQDEIKELLQQVPSLKHYINACFNASYPKAVRKAARETKIDSNKFPEVNPWTIEQCLAYTPKV